MRPLYTGKQILTWRQVRYPGCRMPRQPWQSWWWDSLSSVLSDLCSSSTGLCYEDFIPQSPQDLSWFRSWLISKPNLVKLCSGQNVMLGTVNNMSWFGVLSLRLLFCFEWSWISKVYLDSMCTAVLIGWDPATPLTFHRIRAHIRGRYWSAKTDISLRPPSNQPSKYNTKLQVKTPISAYFQNLSPE